RAVAATLLPVAILERRNRGFGGAVGTWFRGDMRELFADTLLSPSSLRRGYFQPVFVRRIVDEHLAGKRDHTLRLWQLVVFEKWLQQYVDGTRAAGPAERNRFPPSAPAGPFDAVFSRAKGSFRRFF